MNLYFNNSEFQSHTYTSTLYVCIYSGICQIEIVIFIDLCFKRKIFDFNLKIL